MKISVTHHVLKASTIPVFCRRSLCLLVAACFALITYAQTTIQVKGRLTDEGGNPIEGASVLVKGTTAGVTTNKSGNFEISAPSNGTLVISYSGYQTREIRINNSTSINVSLQPDTKDIEGVVVVGYGTQRKKDVTGAVTSVSEQALREVPVANLQQALQGRAAGLEVQRVGNRPGAGAVIRIRGVRSISGNNDPLIVLDGIPYEGTLNDINPDDIASVDILKDASSTAIYGSRGANGVILLTSKKGRTGTTRVSYNGYYGVGVVANKYPVFNAEEYQAMRNTSTWGQGYMAEELNGITLGRNTDWQDLMYENSMRTDHNITVMGGSEGNNFSLGGGYYKETTVMPGEDYTRYSLRASIDTRIGKRIKIGLVTLNNVSTDNGSQFVSGAGLFRMLALSPLMSAYNPDGSIYVKPAGNIDDVNGSDRYSPLYLKNNNNNWVDRVRRLRTFNSLYAEYQIISGLRYRFNLGLNYAQQHSAQFRGSDQPNNPSFFRPAQGNTARVENGETWGYTAENLVYYDKTIKEHKIGFTGLYSIQESQSFSNFVQKDSITEDFVQFYHMGAASPTPVPTTGGVESRWALISYMARVNYSFRDRYLLTFTYRRDGSSRLAEGNKWFNYPAVSAGWVISDEAFMKNITWLSSLKLRAGWGKTSNQAIAPYAALGLVNNSNGLNTAASGLPGPGGTVRYNYGPTIVTGYNVITLPNPDLSWEFTRMTNIGLDFSLFKNRLTGSVELYHARTNDILYNVLLPVTSGVQGAFATNIGEMENKGVELSLSGDIYRGRTGFTWSADLNLFFNRNKILKLSNQISEERGAGLFVGHSINAIHDYNKLGIWQSHEAAQAALLGATPGQVKLEDYGGPNGKPDGVISAVYDKYVIGDGDANLQGGMTHRFSFKGFDLSAVFYARFGGMLISQIHQPNSSYLTPMDGRRNGLKVDYWTPTNPSNWFPMPQQSISNLGDAWTTLGYYDGTFVKLRSINLGYTFNRNILRYFNGNSARIYFTIDNVAVLFSPYYNKTGIDPEGTGQGNQGVSNPGNIRANNNGNGVITIGLATPPRRTFTLGLNISL